MEMVKIIVKKIALLDITNPDGYDYEFLANSILDEIEKAGMKPPCVDSEKCQWLLRTYVDPNFYYWDEDFEAKKDKYEKELKRG